MSRPKSSSISLHSSSSVEMMAYSLKKEKKGLLRSVQERAFPAKSQNESHVPYLDEDCISSILVRLPVDVIDSSRLVCKLWHNIISNPTFVDLQFTRSESVLIFLKSVPKETLYPYTLMAEPPGRLKTFSVEASFLQTKPLPFFKQSVGNSNSKFQIHFMKFSEGKSTVGEYKVCCLGKIRAACNGLILLDDKLKKGGLIVMNPVTKKLMALPLGTLFPSHAESYGFAFSSSTREYKVVHLFRDELGCVGCEILNLRTRCWKEVNGPSAGLFGWLGYRPISAIGALHWIPQVDHFNYIVSMDVENEKFHTTPLPVSCRIYDRIIEMTGCLCLVTHQGLEIDIWNMKSLSDSWTMQHKIRKGVIIDLVPIFSLKICGDLIFWREENCAFYVYDFKLGRIRAVVKDQKNEIDPQIFLPHVSSLVSWTS